MEYTPSAIRLLSLFAHSSSARAWPAAFGEEAISRRLLQRVINRAGLDLGPTLRTPDLQFGPHLVAMRAAGEVHDTEHQELRRRHAPTSAQPSRLDRELSHGFDSFSRCCERIG